MKPVPPHTPLDGLTLEDIATALKCSQSIEEWLRRQAAPAGAGSGQITESEALAIAVRAAEMALAARPAPSSVNLGQAAEILSVSRPTARRMLAIEGISANAGGKYRIEDVWRVRGAGPRGK